VEEKKEQNTQPETTETKPESKNRVDLEAMMKDAEGKQKRSHGGRKTKYVLQREAKEKKLQSAKNFEEYYNLTKLENDKYLHEIFEGNDREYLKNLARECKQKKYPASPLLNEFLFLSVLNRRLHINFTYLQTKDPTSSDIDKISRQIQQHQQQINNLTATLESYREEKQKEIDLAALHDTVLKEAESYIRQHIGEYSFKCNQCGEMVQTDGLPHWAFKRGNDEEGNPIYFLWNQELWLLVEKQLMSVAYMAFALHTSIQGLKWTYEERNKDRGLQFPKWIDIAKEEDVLKGLQQMWKDYEMLQQRGRIEKLGVA
jgi:hypothetical protein